VICGALLAVAAAVWLQASSPQIAAAAAGGSLFGYLLSWGLRPALGLAPLRDLPVRTSAAGRFAARLLLRSQLLERAAARLPRRARAPLLDAAREARVAAEAPELKGAGPVPAVLLEQAAALDGMLDSLPR
jgi:hypothetical protein